MVLAGVWITSALYSIPKFIFSRTITMNYVHLNRISEEICIMHRGLFNSKLLDSINLSALYILPLLVMTVSLWNGVEIFRVSNISNIRSTFASQVEQ